MTKKLDKDAVKFLLQNVDNFMFDCDGVLWHGHHEIPGSKDTVQKLVDMGKRVFYVTNNSSNTRERMVQKCHKLGFPAEVDNIIGTAYTSALYLKSLGFKDKLYVVGNPSMGHELDLCGIKHTGIGPDTMPESVTDFSLVLHEHRAWVPDPEVKGVLVGFDPHLSFIKMIKGASYANNPENLFIATNEDSYLPTPEEHVVIPGTGSIVAAVKIPAHREPLVVGKPGKLMFDMLHETHGLEPDRTLMVGDRLNTDIMMAGNCGLHSLLVQTGCDNLAGVEKYQNSSDPEDKKCVPEYYTDTLGDFKELMGDGL